MILSIDFDGTICRDEYPSIGCPQPYAVDTLQTLAADGHYLIINSCREGARLTEAINWLLEHDIPFHRVNDNHPDATANYGSNSRKVFADIYIDDRNAGGFPGWLIAYEQIKEKQEAYEKAETTSPAA